MNFMQTSKWSEIAEKLEKGESLQNAVNEVLAERPPPASRKSRVEITMPKLKDDITDISLLSPAEQRTILKLERRYKELEYDLKSHVEKTIKEYEEKLDREYVRRLKELDEEYAEKLKKISG